MAWDIAFTSYIILGHLQTLKAHFTLGVKAMVELKSSIPLDFAMDGVLPMVI